MSGWIFTVRVNVPIKLTKIYIETFLVHKILVSVQKVVKILISHIKIFNFILNDKRISIKICIIKFKRSGCA